MTALRSACTSSGCCRAGIFILRLDLVERDREQQIVDVVAAQVRVAVGRDDLEDALVQLEDGDIEGAAAEIVDGDDAFFLRDRAHRPAPPLSAH